MYRYWLFGILFSLSVAAHGDPAEVVDPTRPVMRLGRDHAMIQWFTRTPCASRIQVRQGAWPSNTPGPNGKPENPWKSDSRVAEGPGTPATYHTVEVRGLKPGTRYYYRVYDPGAESTGVERSWGAEKPWRREYAFSTLAPAGRKTVIRLPVKVLLMPNVVNVASAHTAGGQAAAPPPKMSDSELALIRREYADSARFLFINSRMRLWIDYRFVVDERRQRWGEEPANVSADYRGWPVCRSYTGKDFDPPGGGAFTFVDADNPAHASSTPLFDQRRFAGQIEQAFVRRWNPARSKWEFYNSGGGTLGFDEWHKGVGGRSQFLGGGDTAWLATHEFHHQLESVGAFSLSNREDDRVIFDHFFPRRRAKKADGTWDEWTWNTSWKHGEHWDGISWFDRMLTPVQWLRTYFGETVTAADSDEDGVPDDDAALPFDEKRFGSNPKSRCTDGRLDDLAKIQLGTWAPTILTPSWEKPDSTARYRPNPKAADSDRDGLEDGLDPYPLYPWQPFIWPLTAEVDGKDEEWKDVPLAGTVSRDSVSVSFRQGHDDAAYYAAFRMTGLWGRVLVALDGEGQGYYSTDATYAFEITPAEGGATVRPTSGNRCPGLAWKAGVDRSGATVVEVSIPNRGEGIWFWTGGGREVGAAIGAFTKSGTPLSVYEPYHFFYARMLERSGRAALPPGAPAELKAGDAALAFDFTTGSPDPRWKYDARAWRYENGAMRYTDREDASQALYLDGFGAKEFDLWVEFEAKNDMHLAGFTGEKMDSETDYVAFLGGFGNARSVVRLFGQEAGAEESGIDPGRHTMQLTRRNRQVWLFYDGKPIAHAVDPSPNLPVKRLGILGGWGGSQTVYRARLRVR